MPQVFRVKLTHRPHYGGFYACAFHARQLSGVAEVTEVPPEHVTPLPPHAVAAGHTHCYSCNREKGLALSTRGPSLAEG